MIAKQEGTCDKPMKQGGTCLLNPGHKAHCRKYGVWTCDGCGRQRVGPPAATGPDGEYENAMRFCFLCVEVPARSTAAPHYL